MSDSRVNLPVVLRGNASTKYSGRGRNTASTLLRNAFRMSSPLSPGATTKASGRFIAPSLSSGMKNTPSCTPGISFSMMVQAGQRGALARDVHQVRRAPVQDERAVRVTLDHIAHACFDLDMAAEHMAALLVLPHLHPGNRCQAGALVVRRLATMPASVQP